LDIEEKGKEKDMEYDFWKLRQAHHVANNVQTNEGNERALGSSYGARFRTAA
jgi:hypothetical protein